MSNDLVYNCTECSNPCLNNQNSLCCDNCDKWTHLYCTNITMKRFNFLSTSDATFFCHSCLQKITYPVCLKYEMRDKIVFFCE